MRMDSLRRGRIEDRRFLTGQGRYGDDTAGPALVAAFVRADLASARIVALDVSEARDMPGVVAVLTGADLAGDGIGPVQVDMKVRGPDGRDWLATPRPLMPVDRVRHLGEPLAV
ncbi:carbon monoxide dehydrogenase, partial [Pseudooceanicola lipolyticus]